jgi:putative transcriptional regulator
MTRPGVPDDVRPGALVGRLLVSTPWLADPNFRRTVVLLLDHQDEGAFGVVLNRPTGVEVDAVLPGWQVCAAEPGGLFEGGPVGLDSAIGVAVLPPDGTAVPGVDPVVGRFGIVDLDGDPDDVAGRVVGARIFAGHSGWGGGQLEQELDDGGWYVVDAEVEDLVTPAPDQLWRRVLRRQGGDLAIVSLYPEDPRLN